MITTLLGTCDCCGKEDAEISRVIAYGIETFACEECLGITPKKPIIARQFLEPV